jgi:hypothetical protein
MDPNETLKQFRRTLERAAAIDPQVPDAGAPLTALDLAPWVQQAQLLAEAVDYASQLDAWLCRGGFLPTAWDHK